MSEPGKGRWMMAGLVVLAAALSGWWWLQRAPDPAPAPAPAAAPAIEAAPAPEPPPLVRAAPPPSNARGERSRRPQPLAVVEVAAAPGVPVDGPLVFGLHGRGDTAQAFSRISGSFGQRLTWRFLAAPLPWQTGFAWFSDHRRKVPEAEIDAALAALHDHVSATARKRPVGLFGFSQGCMIILRYLALHPKQVAAAVCVGGAVVGDLGVPGDHPTTPILFVHGTSDAVVPASAARAAIQDMENRGFQTEFIEHGGGHEIPADEVSRIANWMLAKLAFDQPRLAVPE